MRAFDVLTKAEVDIRASMQPRYHLEMALLRWIHLRKLVPLTELIDQGLDAQAPSPSPSRRRRRVAAPVAARSAVGAGDRRVDRRRRRPARRQSKAVEARRERRRRRRAGQSAASRDAERAAVRTRRPVRPSRSGRRSRTRSSSEVQKAKKFFYGTVVAQAQRIDVDGDRIVFTFAPQHRALRVQLDQIARWLEAIAIAARRPQDDGRRRRRRRRSGRRAPSQPRRRRRRPRTASPSSEQQALADTGVQAMLDVFAAEIKEVEER